MMARIVLSYLVTMLGFTVLAYSFSFLVFHIEPGYFISLLSFGFFNLFVSALLSTYSRRRSPSKSQRAFFLSAITVLIVIEGSIISWASPASIILTSTGTLRSVKVGVYEGLSGNVFSIDWGELTPGSQKDVTILVRNEGNAEAILQLSTENWDPESAARYIDLSWDYGGNSLSPGEVIQTTLRLRVSESIEGITHFTFDIVITVKG